MKLADLYTRPTANTSRKMYVELPDGTSSDEYYLEVLNVESDAFRIAETNAKRKAVEYARLEDEDEISEKQRALEADMLASLVVGWNFEDKFSKGAVIELLTESAGNRDKLARFSATRSHWFSVKPKSSSGGSKKD